MKRIFYKLANREMLTYIISGIGAILVNVSLFQILTAVYIDYKLANLIAIILAKIFAYITNKLLVFQSHSASLTELFKEMLRFVYARGFTGLIDYFGLVLAVELFQFEQTISKYMLAIIVAIVNYILGKYVVFFKERT
ncbi:MAG: GtrA family protein [Deferribacteraceae bacterium]|jgi:putative flippase GtrA|nr:GtrA family protein [Deferribacteraceae bacterium]